MTSISKRPRFTRTQIAFFLGSLAVAVAVHGLAYFRPPERWRRDSTMEGLRSRRAALAAYGPAALAEARAAGDRIEAVAWREAQFGDWRKELPAVWQWQDAGQAAFGRIRVRKFMATWAQPTLRQWPEVVAGIEALERGEAVRLESIQVSAPIAGKGRAFETVMVTGQVTCRVP